MKFVPWGRYEVRSRIGEGFGGWHKNVRGYDTRARCERHRLALMNMTLPVALAGQVPPPWRVEYRRVPRKGHPQPWQVWRAYP